MCQSCLQSQMIAYSCVENGEAHSMPMLISPTTPFSESTSVTNRVDLVNIVSQCAFNSRSVGSTSVTNIGGKIEVAGSIRFQFP